VLRGRTVLSAPSAPSAQSRVADSLDTCNVNEAEGAKLQGANTGVPAPSPPPETQHTLENTCSRVRCPFLCDMQYSRT
jgi:hypothetical protein